MASTKFGTPGDLDNEALAKAIEEARSHGAELSKIKDEDITDEQLSDFSDAAAFISEAKSEQDRREQVKNERSEQLQSLRDQVAQDDKPEEEDEEKNSESAANENPDSDEDKSEDQDPQEDPKDQDKHASQDEEEEPAEEPAPDVEGDPDAVIINEEIPAEEDEDEKKKEKADVSDKASLANAANHSQRTTDVPAEQSNVSLTASANVSGVPAGKEYDSLTAAAEAINSAMKALPSSGRGRTRQSALTFRNTSDFVQDPTGNDTEILMQASNEANLKGGSLVAAGGWAAPSEQLLDFCKIETADGLISLPGITINRGGVNYTKGPDFTSVLASNVGFWDMTEAQAEAGSVEKTAIRPGIPQFTDIRLDAVGAMMEAGILTRHGWPELVERYAQLTMLAHEVRKHHKQLREIERYVGEPVNLTNGFGNALDLLHVLDIAIAGERQRYALGQNATLEVLIPFWVKTIIRIDLANRTGVDLLNISDAQINSWFSSRGVSPQFLNHWQDIDLDTNGFATALPEDLRVIFYPAGTFVKGEQEVLTLDTLYDSTLLKKNDYVHLFTEQGMLVANPCFDGHHAQLPFHATGRTGAADISAAFAIEAAAGGGEG